MSTDNSNSFDSTEVAILLTTCNKYTPGTQTFRLQSIVGLQENSTSTNTVSVSKSNLVNKDTSVVPLSSVTTTDTIDLEVPKDVTRNYPTKFIPPGTRFIVAFTGGDITKPIIVGREF